MIASFPNHQIEGARRKRRLSRSLLWLALAISILAAFWVQRPYITDPYAVEEDFRNAFWMHRFQDGELFQDENLSLLRPRYGEYNIGPIQLILDNGSPGYSLLFQAASYLFPVVLFSKLLIFPLLLVSVYYIYRIGQRIRGDSTGLVMSLVFIVLNLASPSAIFVGGGLQRSFVFPILLAMTYYLMTKRDWAATGAISLGGIVYPPAFVLGVTTYGLSLLKKSNGRPWVSVNWRRALPLFVSVALVILILTPILISQLGGTEAVANGSPNNSNSLTSDPRHIEGGRQQLFDLFPLVGRGGLTVQGFNLIHIVILSVLTLIIVWLKPTTLVEFPCALKLLFIASFICFALSWAAALLSSSFILYFPSRYTQASVFLFVLIFVALHFGEGLRLAGRAMSTQGRGLFYLVLPIAVMTAGLAMFQPKNGILSSTSREVTRTLLLGLTAVLLILAMLVLKRSRLGPEANSAPRRAGLSTPGKVVIILVLIIASVAYIGVAKTQFLVANSQQRQLYRSLETLPKDIRLAGNPCDLDNVPLFAKRMILFSCERLHPDSDVVMAGLRAYYAPSFTDVMAFCMKNDVDYMIVNQTTFDHDYILDSDLFFEPYASTLRSELEGRTVFALSNVPDEMRLFETGNIYVVPCADNVPGVLNS